jgi:hypothetical protein
MNNDKFIAALMGKCLHTFDTDYAEEKCKNCGETYYYADKFSTSLDGEITKEVRDRMAKEMPEWWEKYLIHITSETGKNELYKGNNFATLTLDKQLSIINLVQYIVDNYKEMFMEECPECFGKGGWHRPDDYGDMCFECNGTGKIPISRFAAAVKMIKEEK